MSPELNEIKNQALAAIAGAETPEALEAARVHYLGRKGIFSEQMKELSQLDAEKRKPAGQKLNTTKNEIAAALKNKEQTLMAVRVGESTWLDVTLPGEKPPMGHLHPITPTIYEIEDIFWRTSILLAYP